MTRIGWVCSILLHTHTVRTCETDENQYGLGSMGLAMANNLQRHLATKNALSLLYNNRTMARGDALKALGGTPAASFEQLVGKCGIIFTMVCLTHHLGKVWDTSIVSYTLYPQCKAIDGNKTITINQQYNNQEP